MLDPSSQFPIPDGDTFYFAPFQSSSERFDGGIVVAENPSLRGDLGGAIGDQLEMTVVGVGRPVREERGSVDRVNLRPREFPIDVLRAEVATPGCIVAGFEAAARVANGGARPRVRIGYGVGVGHHVSDGEKFDAVVVVVSSFSVCVFRSFVFSAGGGGARRETAHEGPKRKVLHVRNLLQLRVHVCIHVRNT